MYEDLLREGEQPYTSFSEAEADRWRRLRPEERDARILWRPRVTDFVVLGKS